jgi:hypothetical protein
MGMEDLIEYDGEHGLDAREYTLISRIYQICVWLARHKRREVVKLIQEEYGVTVEEAEVWVRKAEDFMALGVLEGAATAKQVYNLRLQRIFDLCMANAQRDIVEITTKPTRIYDVEGKAHMQMAQHTKVKPQSLDSAALALAMKAAKEMAILNGGRAAEGKNGVTNNFVQINNNEVPGAQTTQDLSNEQLAQLAGVVMAPIQVEKDHVEVLPRATPAGATDAEGGDEVHPAAEAEGEG